MEMLIQKHGDYCGSLWMHSIVMISHHDQAMISHDQAVMVCCLYTLQDIIL